MLGPVPHLYVAGLCVERFSERTRTWLLTTWPFHASSDYEQSKIRIPVVIEWGQEADVD